tara:strand:+ start:9448 stop:10083 length:636 start_codon:yes stop_codon:yes gene_type:complete
MKNKVGVLNIGISNLGKICNALDYLGVNPVIINNQKDLINSERIIFPGIGNFGVASRIIKRLNWYEVLREHCLIKKKPYFGICLGMQILCNSSQEAPNEKGLKIFNLECRKLKTKNKNLYTIPHIGLNIVKPSLKNKHSRIQVNIKEKNFYFIHSYYIKFLKDKDYMKGLTQYDENLICSFIEKENIFASQFHPELSGPNGLKLIKSFLKL